LVFVPAIHGSASAYFRMPATPSWHGVRRAEAALRPSRLTQLSYAGIFDEARIIAP
jgi:hypothetical protein